MRSMRFLAGSAVSMVLFATSPALASDAPIADLLLELGEEVATFNDHLTTLASPFMEGRVPGSRGMETAKEYMEYYFRESGLEPAFPATVDTPASYRQAFPLGGTLEVTDSSVSFTTGDESHDLVYETDYSVMGLGGGGEVEGNITFVGYSIDDGPEGYASFADGDDFTGRIVMMLRFEPMTEEGKSLWTDNGQWSRRASFAGKVRAVASRNPAAIIVVNTPGADPRVNELTGVSGSGRRLLEAPVLMMTAEAADRVLGMADTGLGLAQLRRLADRGRVIIDSPVPVKIAATIERHSLQAENVAGVLPGKGDLASEYILIGAHLDHLGMGFFGSRSGPGELHPGADDNASGCAGLIIFADRMKAAYDALPEDARARSLIFMAFSGEESGLNGSRYYVDNPIVDIGMHDLMINFDMIGRITDKRLSVSGVASAAGLAEFIAPFCDESPLEVVVKGSSGAGSDHLSFVRRNVPILFGILADFHADYHTPADVSSKINRVDAVNTIRLFSDIVLASAQRSEGWDFQETPRGGSGERPNPANFKVRFGVIPGTTGEDEIGVAISSVTDGGSAVLAGLLPGDRLIRWDGQKLEDVRAWMTLMAAHEPGDEVKVGVMRDGEEITLDVTLQAR